MKNQQHLAKRSEANAPKGQSLNDGVRVEFEVWQGGTMVASVSGFDGERVFNDAMHYAMMYGQDGEVEVIEVSDTNEFEKHVPAHG